MAIFPVETLTSDLGSNLHGGNKTRCIRAFRSVILGRSISLVPFLFSSNSHQEGFENCIISCLVISSLQREYIFTLATLIRVQISFLNMQSRKRSDEESNTSDQDGGSAVSSIRSEDAAPREGGRI